MLNRFSVILLIKKVAGLLSIFNINIKLTHFHQLCWYQMALIKTLLLIIPSTPLQVHHFVRKSLGLKILFSASTIAGFQTSIPRVASYQIIIKLIND
jgi:hypothetical protein